MPFAQLPVSGFQAPQAPSWAPFALQANQAIMQGAALRERANENLTQSVQNAANQIDQVLQMSSPEAKMQRQLHLLQLSYMSKVYNDYRQNPDAFINTANGPIPKNSYQGLKMGYDLQQEVMRIKNLAARTNKLTNPPANPMAPYIQSYNAHTGSNVPVPSMNNTYNDQSEAVQDASDTPTE